MDKQLLNKTKLFEKIEINWFTVEQMKKRRNEFRNFYREFIDEYVQEEDKIKEFVKKCMKKTGKNKTRKNR